MVPTIVTRIRPSIAGMILRRALLLLFAVLALPDPASAQQGDPSFVLVNRSGRVIYAVFASPASDTNWGQDRLGNDIIRDGQSYPIRLPRGECVYDVRVVYDRQGGPAEERRNINTCTTRELVFGAQAQGAQPAPPPQPPPAAPEAVRNPSFNLVNGSNRTVREVYASLSTDSNWGPDRLGSGSLPGGQFHPIRLPLGECVYDIRVVYESGAAEERRRVNLCQIINLILPLQ